MAQVEAWHSIKFYEPFVYHDETECHTGNNVEPEYVVQGRGMGRRHCEICEEIQTNRFEMIAALAHRIAGRIGT